MTIATMHCKNLVPLSSLLLLLAPLVFLQIAVDGRPAVFVAEEEDLEMERHLKAINKTPVKTIIMDYGDIIDCVDVNKQPAFDHPLLGNHTIQIEPSDPLQVNQGRNKLLRDKNLSLGIFQNEECPPGSIPIRRTTEQDLIRERAFSRANYVLTSGHSSKLLIRAGLMKPVHMEMSNSNRSYTSVSGSFSVWNYPLQIHQMTTSQLWLQTGPMPLASIEAGWMIYPELYGDSSTRLFIQWKPDSSTTWCYDLRCPGFVQTTRFVALGMRLPRISYPNGPLYELHLQIYQDLQTKNWWLYSMNGDIHLGYWPAELFPGLGSGGSLIAWGGIAEGNADHSFPPMGNGIFGDPSNCRITGCFTQMEYNDGSSRHVPDSDVLKQPVDMSCYGLHYLGILEEYGCSFTFGGPSKMCA